MNKEQKQLDNYFHITINFCIYNIMNCIHCNNSESLIIVNNKPLCCNCLSDNNILKLYNVIQRTNINKNGIL
jgi:hypothetical protein